VKQKTKIIKKKIASSASGTGECEKILSADDAFHIPISCIFAIIKKIKLF
jgi:hypothetical protein